VGGKRQGAAPATEEVIADLASERIRGSESLIRPISALAPIARTNNTMRSAYMRGMSNVE
jgi:hypothetical protein